MSHPAVLEAAVIGVPDDKWGERPKAFVLLRAGHSATPQELIAHVRTKIASYKAPRDIVFTADLPKTSTGKIQKFVLRDAEQGRTHPPRIRTHRSAANGRSASQPRPARPVRARMLHPRPLTQPG